MNGGRYGDICKKMDMHDSVLAYIINRKSSVVKNCVSAYDHLKNKQKREGVLERRKEVVRAICAMRGI